MSIFPDFPVICSHILAKVSDDFAFQTKIAYIMGIFLRLYNGKHNRLYNGIFSINVLNRILKFIDDYYA